MWECSDQALHPLSNGLKAIHLPRTFKNKRIPQWTCFKKKTFYLHIKILCWKWTYLQTEILSMALAFWQPIKQKDLQNIMTDAFQNCFAVWCAKKFLFSVKKFPCSECMFSSAWLMQRKLALFILFLLCNLICSPQVLQFVRGYSVNFEQEAIYRGLGAWCKECMEGQF